jgi:hypothetical protein
MTHIVECLPNKYGAQSSIPSTAKQTLLLCKEMYALGNVLWFEMKFFESASEGRCLPRLALKA